MADIELDRATFVKIVDEAIRDKTDKIFAISQKNIIDLDLVNTAFLLKSGNVTRIGDAHYRITYSAPYAAAIEHGSMPHMPPVDAIEFWVRSKLKIAESQNPRGIAWAIAKNIEKKGTIPRPYLIPAFDQVRMESK